MAIIIPIGSLFRCYLVTEGPISILVDTGPASAREKVYRAAREKNARLIVLTHGHMDHVANAAYLSRMLKIPVAIHRDDYPLILNAAARDLHTGGLLGRAMKGMSDLLYGRDTVELFEPAFFLEDGMHLGEYGVAATIHALPGHTKGSIGVLVDGYKLLVGDAMMNLIGKPDSKLFENQDEMRRSLARIDQINADALYPGHGRIIRRKESP